MKRFTLELMNRQSIAGDAVSPAYNGQSDILGRIPNLINEALTQISLTLDPFGKSPDTLPENVADTYELSVPDAWAYAACHYAAAYLVADSNEFLYAALMNEFEAFVTRLSGGRIRAEYAEVRPAYGFGGAECLL